MPGGRYPWAVRAGGPLLGGGTVPILDINFNAGQALPASSTYFRTGGTRVRTIDKLTNNFWYQEALEDELQNENQRRVRQHLTNADWTGGTLPTGWTAPLGTGTRTVVSSGLNGPGAVGIRFQATNERPFLRQQNTVQDVEVGEFYIVAVFCEATTGVGTSQILNFNGSSATFTLLNTLTVNEISAGEWGMAICQITGAGNLGVSIGPGGNGNEAGPTDITMSSPIIARAQDADGVFGDWVNDTVTYNANVPGVKYFTTNNNNTRDTDGVVTLVAGTPLTDGHFLRVPEATNIIPESNDFNTTWTANNITPTSLDVGDAGFVAQEIDAGSAVGSLPHNFSVGGGPNSAGSMYAIAEAGTGQFMVLSRGDVTSYACFDLINGTITQEGAGLTGARIKAEGGGRFKCRIFTAQVTTTMRVAISDTGTPGSGAPAFQAADETLIIHFNQGENTQHSTPPIPTVGGSATRLGALLTDVNWPTADGSSAVVDVLVDDPIATQMNMLGYGGSAANFVAVDAPTDAVLNTSGLSAAITASTTYEGERHQFGISQITGEGIITDDELNDDDDLIGGPGGGAIVVGSAVDRSGQPCAVYRVRVFAKTQTVDELRDLF